ncbi:MAG: hypothetical protein DME50_14110 [Verrucomicrobia bacterium]|nr:MAG: hypothetical protein DME50_14110 [Verrucomicrobiota bacterium]
MRAKIHPTAIVELGARIGTGVEIGPFSLIGSEAEIGDRTIVLSHVVVEGKAAIGSDNFIGHGVIIGAPPQDVSFSPDRNTSVEIGNNNVIREYCTIHRGMAKIFLWPARTSGTIALSEATSSLQTIVYWPDMYVWMTAPFSVADPLFTNSCILGDW